MQLHPVKPFEMCGHCGKETDERDFCPHCRFLWLNPLAFGGSAWAQCNFTHLALTKSFRQTDRRFFDLLMRARGPGLSQTDVETLLKPGIEFQNGLSLYATNIGADEHNQRELEKLPGPSVEFPGGDHLEWNSDTPSFARKAKGEKALAEHRLRPSLEMRIGMPVMISTNIDQGRKLVNGMQGQLVGFQQYGRMKVARGDFYDYRKQQVEAWFEEHEIQELPVVRLADGSEHLIHPVCMVESVGDLEEGKAPSLVSRTQIPLIPGWALTIHKSQSLTLENVRAFLAFLRVCSPPSSMVRMVKQY